MTTSNYELALAGDRIIRGTVHLPARASWPAPVILFCHGFKGFKDWGGWPWLCAGLAQDGFVVNRFNFSLGGVGAALDRHNEPEKFARNTHGCEIEDLEAIAARIEVWGVPRAALGGGLGVIGHSRGGLTAILWAAEQPRVGALMTLASIARADRLSAEQRELWRRQGYLEVVNARTGQVLRLDRSILDDLEEQRDRYDLRRAVCAREVPTLVVHGEDDESVDPREAEQILAAVPHARKQMVCIPGTGHTFGAVQPFAGPTPELQRVRKLAAAWFGEHLAR